jgi:hypothetical protein
MTTAIDDLSALLGNPPALRLVEDQVTTAPLFRCCLCGATGPIRFQWRTEDQRWCASCAPRGAIKSAELELYRRRPTYSLRALARIKS